MSDRGRFITFEGGEGCGKTTQVALAKEYLALLGISCLVTAEPGGTVLGETIRRMILYETELHLGPESELLLFCAARAQHVRQVIKPALQAGRWVLCDRFCDATVAYQGYGRGLELDLIYRLNRFSSLHLEPDLTILFDISVEIGLNRAKMKTASFTGHPDGDLIEGEDYYFHRRVRDGYLQLAQREPERLRVIDGVQDIETIHSQVCDCLERLR